MKPIGNTICFACFGFLLIYLIGVGFEQEMREGGYSFIIFSLGLLFLPVASFLFYLFNLLVHKTWRKKNKKTAYIALIVFGVLAIIPILSFFRVFPFN